MNTAASGAIYQLSGLEAGTTIILYLRGGHTITGVFDGVDSHSCVKIYETDQPDARVHVINADDVAGYCQ